MSPSVDPVAFALGVLGIWVGLSFALAALWVLAGELYAWRRAWRVARAWRARSRAPFDAAPVAGSWLDLGDADWRWPAGH